mmetsp:Transcript_44077/g.95601  ORF Transcript_44077/g.95601 Transcript_44077/m.95601 type:complete len:372 (-) Transcript_44077:47-1162(-)
MSSEKTSQTRALLDPTICRQCQLQELDEACGLSQEIIRLIFVSDVSPEERQQFHDQVARWPCPDCTHRLSQHPTNAAVTQAIRLARTLDDPGSTTSDVLPNCVFAAVALNCPSESRRSPDVVPASQPEAMSSQGSIADPIVVVDSEREGGEEDDFVEESPLKPALSVRTHLTQTGSTASAAEGRVEDSEQAEQDEPSGRRGAMYRFVTARPWKHQVPRKQIPVQNFRDTRLEEWREKAGWTSTRRLIMVRRKERPEPKLFQSSLSPLMKGKNEISRERVERLLPVEEESAEAGEAGQDTSGEAVPKVERRTKRSRLSLRRVGGATEETGEIEMTAGVDNATVAGSRRVIFTSSDRTLCWNDARIMSFDPTP